MMLGLYEQEAMTRSNFNYAGQVETWRKSEYKQGIV